MHDHSSDEIPNYALHPDFFCIKRMEDIYEEHQGRPDQAHSHSYYTLLLISKGKGVHTIDFQNYTIENEQVHLVAPGQIHQVSLKEKPKGYALMFNEDFLLREQIPHELCLDLFLDKRMVNPCPIAISTELMSKILTLAEQMESITQKRPSYFSMELGALLKLLLVQINRLNEKIDHPMLSHGSQLAVQFRSLVEANFHRAHQVQFYAEQLSITGNYLNEVIKAQTGISAKAFISRRLSLEAKRLALTQAQLSSKEIAYRLGFEDPSHFSKFFKNQNDISFSDFQMKGQEG